MGELFKKWELVEEILGNADAMVLQSIVCMMIDYAAVKSGMSSKELLDKITPIIIACNEQLGQMTV